MKWRVEMDVSFDDESDALDFMNRIENVKDKAYKPKGTEKIACYRKCRYHLCTHDEIIPTPCEGYVDVDFDKEKKEHQPK